MVTKEGLKLVLKILMLLMERRMPYAIKRSVSAHQRCCSFIEHREFSNGKHKQTRRRMERFPTLPNHTCTLRLWVIWGTDSRVTRSLEEFSISLFFPFFLWQYLMVTTKGLLHKENFGILKIHSLGWKKKTKMGKKWSSGGTSWLLVRELLLGI